MFRLVMGQSSNIRILWKGKLKTVTVQKCLCVDVLYGRCVFPEKREQIALGKNYLFFLPA